MINNYENIFSSSSHLKKVYSKDPKVLFYEFFGHYDSHSLVDRCLY